jgi:hypothetical protein
MQNAGYVRIHDLRRHHMIVKRFRDWRRWKLGLPLLALLLIYPVYKFLAAGNEFISALRHGELLLFSALILIELSVEAAHTNEELHRGVPDSVDGLIENSRLGGVFLILVYGAMKFLVDQKSTLNQIDSVKATAYCVFCLTVTFLVLSFIVFAFYKTLSNAIQGESL